MGDHGLNGLPGRLKVLPGVEVIGMLCHVFADGTGHGQTKVAVDIDLAHSHGTVSYTHLEMGLNDLAGLDDQSLRPMIGPPLKQGFLGHLGLPLAQAEEAVRIYRLHAADPDLLALLSPYPGVMEMLASLKEKGCKVAIATAKLYDVCKLHVDACGIGKYIDYIGAPHTDSSCDKIGRAHV